MSRPRESLAHSQGGLAIGLTVVRDLVEMHGGTVEAHSAGPDQGSEFVVTLPLLPSLRREPAVDTEPMPRTHGETHRIVIMEDNVDACEVLKRVLEMAGHEVLSSSAPSSRRALPTPCCK